MANIKDVAKLAGVSVTTVSRVMNNRGYISEETRTAVTEAMKVLSYQPNEVARSLYRRQSHMIGVIIPTVDHPFFAKLVRYLEYHAYQEGYKIVLCNSQMQKDKEKEYIEMLRRHQVDGIIMGSHTLDTAAYEELSFPLVSFDRQLSPQIPYVASDNMEGGIMAARLLIEKGCRELVHISGNLSLNVLCNKRDTGFNLVCEESGVCHHTVETEVNVLGNKSYDRTVSELFDRYPEADGIFASSDMIAARVITHCRAANIKIPDQIKIVSYDDTDLAEYMAPALTAVSQPIEGMAKYAVEYLIRQAAGEVVPNETVLPVIMKIRETT